MAKNNIIQPIEMTLAKHSFNVSEKRIIYRVLEQLQDKMTKNVVVADLFGGSSILVDITTRSLLTENSKNRDHIYKALKRLKHISFDVVGEDNRGIYQKDVSIIKDFKYYRNKEQVQIELDEHLKDYYLEKARGFTPYNLEVSFNSSSAYTMKLYEYLSHWRDRGKKKYMVWSVNYLSDYFNVPDSYRRYSKLAEKIFLPAQKELNNNPDCDLYFNFEGLKKGRKYTNVVFEIIDTAERKYTPGELAQSISMNAALNSLLIKSFNFTDKDFMEVESILTNPTLQNEVFEKMSDVSLRYEAGEVEFPKAYLKASLKKLVGQ